MSNVNNSHQRYVFFWRTNSPFSQWHPSVFVAHNIEFNCAEQYMMYRKAILFKDYDSSLKILTADEPRDQKALGRLVKNFNPEVWEENCQQIVYDGNKFKFMQNPDLLDKLLETSGKTLVEASPYDKIWGIGLNEEVAKQVDPSEWPGENLLGKILTKLRKDIENES